MRKDGWEWEKIKRRMERIVKGVRRNFKMCIEKDTRKT